MESGGQPLAVSKRSSKVDVHKNTTYHVHIIYVTAGGGEGGFGLYYKKTKLPNSAAYRVTPLDTGGDYTGCLLRRPASIASSLMAFFFFKELWIHFQWWTTKTSYVLFNVKQSMSTAMWQKRNREFNLNKLQHKEKSSFYKSRATWLQLSWSFVCPNLFEAGCWHQNKHIFAKSKCSWWGKTLNSLSLCCLICVLRRSRTLFKISFLYLKRISLIIQ